MARKALATTQAAPAAAVGGLMASATLLTLLTTWSAGLHDETAVVVMAGLVMASLGMATFYRSGQSELTAVGLLGLFAGLMHGLPALFVAGSIEQPSVLAMLTGVPLVLCAFVGSSGSGQQPSLIVGSTSSGSLTVSARVRTQLIRTSQILTLMSLISYPWRGLLWPFPARALLAAVVTFGIAAFLSHQAPTRRTWITLTGLIALYIALYYWGGGRLVLIGMGVGIMAPLSWSPRSRLRRFMKPSVLVLGIPLLVILSLGRGGSLDSVDRVLLEAEGLQSGVTPVVRYSEILEGYRSRHYEVISDQNGASYLAALVSWVPREFWPDKPSAFGAKIARARFPDRPEDYSLVALMYGEAVANFGYAGIMLITVFVLGGALACDRWRTRPRDPQTSASGVEALSVVLALTSIPNFIWGGAFTAASREGFAWLLAAGVMTMVRGAQRLTR